MGDLEFNTTLGALSLGEVFITEMGIAGMKMPHARGGQIACHNLTMGNGQLWLDATTMVCRVEVNGQDASFVAGFAAGRLYEMRRNANRP